MITKPPEEKSTETSKKLERSEKETKIIQELFRVRMTMLAINANIRQKRFQIPIHLDLVTKPVVAVSQTKHKQDCLILSHRNMHYNVANQSDQQIFDEYDLQDSGLGQGKYGSMNLIHPEQGLVYTSSIHGQQSMCCKWNSKGQSKF